MIRHNYNQRNAKRIRFINNLDAFYRFIEWPNNQKMRFLREHRNNVDRFELAKFFLFNGLNPIYLTLFVLISDVQQGEPILELGPRGAYVRHLNQIVLQFETQNPTLMNSRCYNMETGRVEGAGGLQG